MLEVLEEKHGPVAKEEPVDVGIDERASANKNMATCHYIHTHTHTYIHTYIHIQKQQKTIYTYEENVILAAHGSSAS